MQSLLFLISTVIAMMEFYFSFAFDCQHNPNYVPGICPDIRVALLVILRILS